MVILSVTGSQEAICVDNSALSGEGLITSQGIRSVSLTITDGQWTDQSVSQFSYSAVSDPLQPHGPQHVRPLCPSSSKASILRCSVQLSHPHMTTGKTIALTRQTLCWQSNVSAF